MIALIGHLLAALCIGFSNPPIHIDLQLRIRSTAFMQGIIIVISPHSRELYQLSFMNSYQKIIPINPQNPNQLKP